MVCIDPTVFQCVCLRIVVVCECRLGEECWCVYGGGCGPGRGARGIFILL